VKEKRNPSSLAHRVRAELPADLTGPVDEKAMGTLVPPSSLCRGDSARSGGFVGELLLGYFLLLPCALVQ